MPFDLEWFEELRQEQILQTHAYLLSSEGEYFPLAPARVEEALGNLPANEYKFLAALLQEAIVTRSPEAEDILTCNLKRVLWNYWTPYAMDEAERRVPSARELRAEHKEHLL